MKIFWNLVLFTLPAYAFAQSNWRNSNITLSDGTIVSGQINDLEWDYAPEEIEFRKDGQAIQKFSAGELLRFATDRPALYESHAVSYDTDSENIRNLNKSKEPINLASEKIFLEVKLNGVIGLLYMKTKNGRAHYFIRQDTTVTELLNRSYFSPNGNGEILTNQKYKQQLLLITNDCPDIQSGLKRLAYNEPRLVETFRQINACKNNKVYPLWDGAPNTFKKSSSFGIVVQGLFSSCNFRNYYHAPVGNMNFGAGLFWELYSKKRPNKISFYNELTYKEIATEDGTSYFNLDKSFECDKIKMINAVKFSSPNRSGGRFYAALGINNGIRFNTLVSGRTEIASNLPDFSTGYEVGFSAMIGHSFTLLKTLKISPEIRYDYENDVSNSFVFSNYSLNLQFGLR